MSSIFAITQSPLFEKEESSEVFNCTSWNTKSLKPASSDEEYIETESTDSCDTCSNHNQEDFDAFSDVSKQEFEDLLSESEESAEDELAQELEEQRV